MSLAECSLSSACLRFLLIAAVWWPVTTLAQGVPGQLDEREALTRIQAYLEEERSEEALRLLERVFDQSDPPAFPERFTFLHAVALDAQGHVKEAIILLEQFLEDYPDSSLVHEARLRLGRLHLDAQRPDRAIPVLSRILDLASDEPTRSEALYRLCLAYESNGESLRAIQTALTHVERSEADTRRDLLDYIQGLVLHKMDERSLNHVVEAFPTTYPGDLALIRLLELHSARGDDVLAERGIRVFLQRFPDHPYVQTAGVLLRNVMARIKAHRHVIAAVLPFSDTMKPYTTEAFNGARLAMEEGASETDAVGFMVTDSTLPPDRLIRELSHLLREFSPIALIGPLLAREVRVLANVPDLATVPFITPTATIPNVKQFGRYWFSTAMTPRLQITRMVEYAMRELGYSRFCIMAPRTAHGEELHHLFQRAVVQNGGEVIAAEWYRPGTTDASAQITRIKETDLSLYGELLPLETEEPAAPEEPPVDEEKEEAPLVYTPGFDALFLPGHPTDVAFLAAQLAFFDVRVPLLGTNTWNHPNLLKWGRSSIEGGLFGDALFLETTDPKTRRFIEAYRERFQANPSIFAVQAYDAMSIILDAIRHGASTGPEIREQLFVRHDLPTLGGLGKFDEGGILARKVYMIQIRHGRFIQLN